MTTQTKIKLKRWVKNSPIYLLMLVGILVFVYFAVYRPWTIHKEKKNFEKAEASLNELYEKIVAKIGKPDQEKKVNKCSYASRKFGKGPRSCSIDFILLYKNKDLRASSDTMNAIAKFTGNSTLTLLGEPVTSFKSSSSYPGDQNIRQNYESIAGLTCGIQYTYPSLNLFNNPFSDLAKENLIIELNCGGPAKAEHYPVSN